MLPIKNLIELVVKSLGRGLFILKLTAIQARPQVPRSLSVAVPPGVIVSLASFGLTRPSRLSRRKPTDAMPWPRSPQQKDTIRQLRWNARPGDHGPCGRRQRDFEFRRCPLCWREQLVHAPVLSARTTF